MALKKQDLMDMYEYLTLGLNPQVKKSILAYTGRGGVSAARDYIAANCLMSEFLKANPNANLSKITSKNELWEGLHPATKFRLRAYTPCLAARYDELDEKSQKNLFENPDWVASRKENGARGWLIVYNGQTFLYSRNYSEKDCSLLEYWNNINQQVKGFDQGIYAIDVEIKFEPGADITNDIEALGIATNSPLEAMVALLHTYPEEAVKIQQRYTNLHGGDLIAFRLIAPLYFKGKNYLKRTLGEGIADYHECAEFGRSIGLNVQEIPQCDGNRLAKEYFLDSIIEAGGEGVVFWNKKGSYCTSENRSKTSFIKLKRSISSTMSKQGLGDTFDAFVTGFKMGSNGTANEGLISALEMSVYINKGGNLRKHIIAYVPNIDKATKEMITLNDASGLYPQEVTLSDGTTHWVSMNPDFDQLVGEVNGQALSAVSQRLEHPALVRWRPERDPNSCIYTQEFLDANTTNKGISYKS